MVELKVCHSEEITTKFALEDIFSQVGDIDASKVKGVLIFGDINLNFEEILSETKLKFPSAKIVGGSSCGEMSSTLGWREDSLVFGLLYGDNFSVETIAIENIKESLPAKLKDSFSKVTNPKDTKFCILATDAFSVGGESIARNLKEFLPGTPIIGGMAADQWTFDKTKQVCNEGVFENGLVAMLVSGDFQVDVGTATGWKPETQKVVVTKSEGNVIQEINGQPALDYYESIFGTRNGTFGEYPLAIIKDSEVAYLRAPLTWDNESGTMNFAGEVLEGSEVAICSANRQKVINAVADGIAASKNNLSFKPKWAFATSCAARRQFLGTQSEREVNDTHSGLGEVPVMGFYSYGEYLSSLKYPNNTGFLNESFCLLTVAYE